MPQKRNPQLAEDIARALHAKRAAMGLTQKGMADFLEVSKSTYESWEMGRKVPYQKHRLTLVKKLGLKAEEVGLTEEFLRDALALDKALEDAEERQSSEIAALRHEIERLREAVSGLGSADGEAEAKRRSSEEGQAGRGKDAPKKRSRRPSSQTKRPRGNR